MAVASAAAATHHLLHLHLLHLLPHGWVHVHAAVHGHLGLHHGEVLLHALEVLRHHLRAHAVVVAAAATAHAHAARGVVLAELVALGCFFFLAEIAARLGSLDLNGLSVNLEGNVDAGVDAGFGLEGDEAETTGATGVLVHHESGIDDAAELGKVVAEFLVSGVLADAADEDLGCLFLFVARNGSLGVNLDVLVGKQVRRREGAYNLAVEEVLFDHDNVDRLCIFKCEKAKSSGSTSVAVAHHGAFHHFAKL